MSRLDVLQDPAFFHFLTRIDEEFAANSLNDVILASLFKAPRFSVVPGESVPLFGSTLPAGSARVS